MARTHQLRAALVLGALVAASASGPDKSTNSLDALTFFSPSLLTTQDEWAAVVASVASLNDGLWAAANSTAAEQPWIAAPHPRGVETVVNTSCPACAAQVTNMTNAGGVATLPTCTAEDEGSVFLMKVYGLSYAECASHCCSSIACAAFAWYITSDDGPLCQTFTAAYSVGPQPWPSGDVVFAQGGALGTPPTSVDVIAAGLRSGAVLGGFATGGYELMADGSTRLSTIRGQSPASEPWQGTVRDAVLAVSVNGEQFAVRLRPFGGLQPVPSLVWASAFPVARLEFLGLALYAYSPLRPGDANRSNTPAVIYTLRASSSASGATPVNLSFAVVQPFALRNDWRQAGTSGSTPVPSATNSSACAAACVANAKTCYSWQWEGTPAGCTIDTLSYALGANAQGIDSGHPGVFLRGAQGAGGAAASVTFNTTTVPSAAPLHNALGAQGLYALPTLTAASRASYGAASASTLEALLGTLAAPDPGAAMAALPIGGAGDLFAGAVVSVAGIAPGATIDLSIVHAWRFPHFFWYRDAFSGSDNGARYAGLYPDVDSVVASLSLPAITADLLSWQRVFAGLPDPLLFDAALNLFTHSRSALWDASGEWRQWESFEFIDWGNPTNGDERHLPYFAYVPEAMSSQLETWVKHTQNADGSFYCIIVSGAGDAQYGHGDPCGTPSPANPHPDDITMVLVAAYEQLALANNSAIIAAVYPALLRGFGYYVAHFNASAWHLPYEVHETYDAVPESPTITGEGNLGTSLFNALQYTTGLHCMRELAAFMGDNATEAAASDLLRISAAMIQRNLWQGGMPFYIGDTVQGNAYLTENDGWPYHSSDGLHGQVLAYRLGFGDLLPRLQMSLHQGHVLQNLNSSWGLKFDTYAPQNWLMSDHALSALSLVWNEEGAWNTTLRQLRYWREEKKEFTRLNSVIDTRTGLPALLNYYGYALFFFHTLTAWSGQVASLPSRRLSFAPHFSAFNSSGEALLPIIFGGALGTLLLTPTSATLSMSFLGGERGAQPLSFLNITICQHTFAGSDAAPLVLGIGTALQLSLPTPCDRASPASTSHLVTQQFCELGAPVTSANAMWSQSPLPPPVTGVASLAACQDFALQHYYCGYEWDGASCVAIPGAACYIVNSSTAVEAAQAASKVAASNRTLGHVFCNYSSVYTAPLLVNTSTTALYNGVTFGAGFAPLASAVYTFIVPTLDACSAQAAALQACGWLWINTWAGGILGSCNSVGGTGCCILSPYAGCAPGGSLPPAWGSNATLGIFGAIAAL